MTAFIVCQNSMSAMLWLQVTEYQKKCCLNTRNPGPVWVSQCGRPGHVLCDSLGLPFLISKWLPYPVCFKTSFFLFTQFSLVAQSCPTFCDPMNCSTPGLPVHHQVPESTQTHVHWVSDAIEPSHPLSFSSPSSLFPSIRVFSSELALCMRWPKVLEFQLQHQSFQRILRTDFL